MCFLALLLTAYAADTPFDPGPPLEPSASIDAMQLPDDVVVELVAAEPMVVDPVAIAFDEMGHLFVCEFRDYPTGPAEPDDPPLSQIKRLSDSDGDGRMDRATVFAKKLPFCQGLAVWGNGLIVTVERQVLLLQDEDGDGVADKRTVLIEGLGKINSQLQPGSPRLGPDGWVYVTNGLSGGEIRRPGHSGEISLGRCDFRFHPRQLTIEPATGLGQFGNTFDDCGNRFVSSNRNPAMHIILPWPVLERDPRPNRPTGYHDVIPAGADSRVYPITATNTTAASHAGTHSAACGVEIYRGDWLGPDYCGDILVCDPTAHLVTRSNLIPDGVTFRTERVVLEEPQKADWLTSTDRWFRPVSLANGPDGGLYLVDMYRAVIEHPQYIPASTKLATGLRAGDDLGRIYRIRPRRGKPRRYIPPTKTGDVVAMLEDANGWRRDTAVRLIRERIPTDLPREVMQRLDSSRLVLPIDDADLGESEAVGRRSPLRIDEAHGGRERYLELLAQRDSPPDTVESGWIVDCCSSESKRERLRAVIALWRVPDRLAVPALAQSVIRDGDDPWILSAVFSSVGSRAFHVAQHLAKDKSFAERGSLERCQRIAELAAIVADQGDPVSIAGLIEEVFLPPEGILPAWWQLAFWSGYLEINRRTGREFSDQADRDFPGLKGLAETANDLALDRSQPIEVRLPAAKVALVSANENGNRSLLPLLSSEEPAQLQTVVLDAIRRLDRGEITIGLLERWQSYLPSVQAQILDIAVARPESAQALLSAIRESRVPISALSAFQRATLRKIVERLPADVIRDDWSKILGEPFSPDRQSVVREFEAALGPDGNITRGQAVFRKSCASCHRYGIEGHAVGPDLSDIRTKTAEQILLDILDPNRIVEPRYSATTLLLTDGRTISGIVLQDSPTIVVLRQAGGLDVTVERQQIDETLPSMKSLMPEGLEKEISVEEMVDLLRYLKSGS